MAAAQCRKSLLVLAALTHLACGSTCAEEEGECTLMVGLAKSATWEGFKGNGTAADGQCPLEDAAPALEMKYLSNVKMVIMPYESDRTKCCRALTLLKGCSHVESVELDRKVSILGGSNNGIGIVPNDDNGTVKETATPTCEGAKLVLGECTVLGGLAKGVTAAAFAGDSGTGADGVCALSGHAPEQPVKSLISTVVALKFGTDLDRCCKAKEALDKCKSLTYAEYDSEITTQGSGSTGDNTTAKNDTDTPEADGSGDNSSGTANNTAPTTEVGAGDNSTGTTGDNDDSPSRTQTDSAAAPQSALALLGAVAVSLAMVEA